MTEQIAIISNFFANYAFIVAFIFSLFLSQLFVPAIIKIAKRRGWFDTPIPRKIHQTPIPTLGGVAIFFSVMGAILVFAPYFTDLIFVFILFIICIFLFVGAIDDLKNVPTNIRLIIQFIAAISVVNFDIRLFNLGGLFGIEELNIVSQYVLSILIIMGIINAYNFIDGVDGLAGGLGFISSLIFGTVFYTIGQTAYCIIAFALAGSLLGYLRFNRHPAKIFMGDTGSVMIGFILAIFSIQSITLSAEIQMVSIFGVNKYILTTAIMLVPVFDIIRVFFERIIKGKSPFRADRNHIHHLLIDTGFDHRKTVLILYSTNLALIACAYAMKDLKPEIAFVFLFLIATGLMEFLTIKRFIATGFKIKKNEAEKAELRKQNRFLLKNKH